MQKVAPVRQRNVVELEVSGRRLQAEAHIGHAAGDVRGDGSARERAMFEARDAIVCNALCLQQTLEQKAPSMGPSGM